MPPAVVVLVHGTFAAFDNDQCEPEGGSRFWQCESHFARELTAELGEAYNVAPANPTSYVYHWSGNNSERSRRAAGLHLLRHLQKLEDSQRPYYVVAHSHGGSILWNALKCVATPNAVDTGLPHLKGWITVGTPFMTFIPDWVPSAASFIVLLTTSLVIWRQYSWLRDFWNNQCIDLPYSEITKMFCVPTIQSSVILLVALVGLLLFRLFALAQAQRDPRTTSQIPKAEALLTIQAIKSVLLLLSMLVLAYVFFEPARDLAHRSFHIKLLLPSLYSVLITFCLVVSVIVAIPLPLFRIIQCWQDRRKSQKCWERFSDRYFCIASLQHDEAINGLSLIVNGIEGPLLPRLLPPGGARFTSRAGWIAQPELREEIGSLGLSVLFLPLLIFRDWLVRLPYNEVFAELVDRFVLRRLTRQAHGADLIGLRLGAVAPLPIRGAKSPDRMGGRLREKITNLFEGKASPISPGPETTWVGPCDALSDRLCDSTAESAANFLQGIRSALGTHSAAAASLRNFIQRAMQGEHNAMELLVHTRYFDSPEIVKLIAKCIRSPEAVDRVQTLPVQRTVSMVCPPNIWPPKGFGWWLLRNLCASLLLTMPAIAIGVMGWLILFHDSNEAMLRWAAEPGRTISEAIRTSTLNSEYEENSTPAFVRWWAVALALRRSEASDFDKEYSRIIDSPLRFLAGRAMVAEKLVELEQIDEAIRLFHEIEDALPPKPPGAAENAEMRTIAKAWHLARKNGLSDQLLPRLNTTRFEADVRFGSPPDTIVKMWKLVERLRSEEVETVTGEYGGTGAFVDCIGETLMGTSMDLNSQFNFLQSAIAIRNALEEAGQVDAAQRLHVRLRQLCGKLSGLRDEAGKRIVSVDHLISFYILLAKSYRLDPKFRFAATSLLNDAEREAALETNPSHRMAIQAKIAAGYARLGFFNDARRLTTSATPEEELNIAIQVMAFELERRTSSLAPRQRAERCDRILRAVDEQVDGRVFSRIN